MWSREDVIRELVGSVAIAVQRGGALTYLEGYDRSLHAMHPSHGKRAAAKYWMRISGCSRFRCFREGTLTFAPDRSSSGRH